MVKFAHISDCHLGYTSGKKKDPITKLNIREQDGFDALEETITQIIEDGEIDFVLCSGDWFHSPNPSIHTIVKSQEQLDRLVENNIPFYNIAGNHDSTDAVKDVPSSRILHSPRLGLMSYTEPYVIEEIPNSKVVLHLVSHHGYTAQKETMKDVKPIDGKFNILVTHGSVWDDNLGIMLHSESEPREVVVPEDVLKLDWDYILLGHIHERGWVGSKDGLTDTSKRKIFYGGSLIRRGFADKPCKLGRGWTKWSISRNKMTPDFKIIKQRTQLDHYIMCDNKSIKNIEDEIIDFFKNVDLEEMPIVRISLVDIDLSTKMLLNWKHFDEYTSKCLTFTTKYSTKEEMKIQLSGRNFSFDLLEAFSEFWNEAENSFAQTDRKEIELLSKKYLREGQSIILERN